MDAATFRSHIIEELSLLFGSIENMYLAGSFCYGNPDAASDVDILVVGENKKQRVIQGTRCVYDIKFITPKKLGKYEYNSAIYSLSVLHLTTNFIIKGKQEHEEIISEIKKSANMRRLIINNSFF